MINITSQEAPNCPDNYELPIAWRDNFECYEAFITSEIGEWIIYDLDGLSTYSSNAMDFLNEGYVGSGIIYNQNLATQSGNDPNEEELWNTSSGNQGLYFVAGVPANLVSENNDWMISPEFSLSGISSPVLTFKAKTLKDDWGLERFKIAVGNSTDYNDFITI